MRASDLYLIGPCLLAVPALALAGCGPSPGQVSGTVSYLGKPVVFGTVLVIDSAAVPHYGNIAPDGSYSVSGVSTGPARVAVNSPDPATAGPPQKTPLLDKRLPPEVRKRLGKQRAARTEPAVDHKRWFTVPGRYGDPQTSGLTLEVHAGTNPHELALE